MRRKLVYGCAALLLGAGLGMSVQKKSIDLPDDNAMAKLKPGPGVKVVSGNCSICHSTDYIVRQAKFDKEKWQAEVKKMITVFGAPISDSDAKVIAGYLGAYYGAPAGREKK